MIGYKRRPDSRLGYKVLGLMFGEVFGWIYRIFIFLLLLNVEKIGILVLVLCFCGVCMVGGKKFIVNISKIREVGLNSLLFIK